MSFQRGTGTYLVAIVNTSRSPQDQAELTISLDDEQRLVATPVTPEVDSHLAEVGARPNYTGPRRAATPDSQSTHFAFAERTGTRTIDTEGFNERC